MTTLDRLVRRVQQGDRNAFVELFRACHREVRMFISAHAPSTDVVDEVLQAAFVTCFERIGDYQPRGTFLPWLKGIARNTLLKELRDRARYASVSGDSLNAVLAARALEHAEKGDDAADRVTLLRRCLDRLPTEQRALIDHRYVNGVPLDRLAHQVGRTENWVAVTLFRIRKALQACMEQSGGRT